MYLPPDHDFLSVPKEERSTAKNPKAVIIPFGLESSVSYEGGTAAGPEAIIHASPQIELFDDELWCQPHRQYALQTRKPVKIKKPLAVALKQLEDIVEEELKAGKFPFVLGGEHSLTPGALRPYVKRHKKLTLLHFDAHADLRDGYEGEPFSHAAALRRCLDFSGVRVVSIGIRNLSQGEAEYYKKNKDRVTIFWARDRKKWKIAEIMKALGNDPIYLTFDIDGFDGSVIPATGTPEPGGFFWDDAMDIIRAACKTKNIVGGDLVELAPRKGLHACDFLAAKLVFKILAYRFAKKK